MASHLIYALRNNMKEWVRRFNCSWIKIYTTVCSTAPISWPSIQETNGLRDSAGKRERAAELLGGNNSARNQEKQKLWNFPRNPTFWLFKSPAYSLCPLPILGRARGARGGVSKRAGAENWNVSRSSDASLLTHLRWADKSSSSSSKLTLLSRWR